MQARILIIVFVIGWASPLSFSINATGSDALNQNVNLFPFSDSDCLDWANQSNNDVRNMSFGGADVQFDSLILGDIQSYIHIESQEQFILLLERNSNTIPSGTKLIFLDDMLIDLTGRFGIVVEDNVVLLGSRGEMGKIGTTFMTSDYADPTNYAFEKPLFRVTGNNVMIGGLVFSGPSPIGDVGDFDWKVGRFGIEVDHSSSVEESYIHIINNEFYGFGHAAISINRTTTTQINNSRVIIEQNFIHDQMQFQSGKSGTGYGIVINKAFPLIKNNEFGLNRHDVAHTGNFRMNSMDPLSGYEFAFNLLHMGATDHMVDLHCFGVENSSNCEDFAGDFLHVHNNLFLDVQVGVAIRGAPTIGACIHDNIVSSSPSGFIERKSSNGEFGLVISVDNEFNQTFSYSILDWDGDGITDRSDPDDDNDLTPDFLDAFPFDANESQDSDNDGIGNNADVDDDNDSVSDDADVFPLDSTEWADTDGDGVGNNADLDDDGDFVPDNEDAFPLNASESVDTDIDGLGDNIDMDDDGDLVPDNLDIFPLDSSEWQDSDRDGIGDNSDIDRDGDNVPNVWDAFPSDPSESLDTDLDGLGDNADLDDDNDGIEDGKDAYPLDPLRYQLVRNEPLMADSNSGILLLFAAVIGALLLLNSPQAKCCETVLPRILSLSREEE